MIVNLPQKFIQTFSKTNCTIIVQRNCTNVQLKILHEHLVIQTPNIVASACFIALVKFNVNSNIEFTNVLHSNP